MTDHNQLMAAVMTPDVKTAAQAFVDELVSGTMLAVRQDPRAYGFVTLQDHDARVSELIEANNREIERRRAAEAKAERFDFDILSALQSLPFGCGIEPAASRADPAVCGKCQHPAGTVQSCTVSGCPVMAVRTSPEGKVAA